MIWYYYLKAHYRHSLTQLSLWIPSSTPEQTANEKTSSNENKRIRRTRYQETTGMNTESSHYMGHRIVEIGAVRSSTSH